MQQFYLFFIAANYECGRIINRNIAKIAQERSANRKKRITKTTITDAGTRSSRAKRIYRLMIPVSELWSILPSVIAYSQPVEPLYLRSHAE
jgi:hypothetical protein